MQRQLSQRFFKIELTMSALTITVTVTGLLLMSMYVNRLLEARHIIQNPLQTYTKMYITC